MERETTTIKTPKKGRVVVLKTWLTGREKREIKYILIQDIKLEKKDTPESEGEELKNNFDYQVTPESLTKSQDRTIEMAVVSVDGSKENVLDTTLDMHHEDFNFVMDKIEELTGDKKLDEDVKN